MLDFTTNAKGRIFSYTEFMDWTEELVANEKTSGPKQTEALINFTALNLKRMQRLNKTLVISEETRSKINQLPKNQKWWVITEAWCGDSAQNLPFIGKLAEASEQIDLNIILRDENPDLIDEHLTNGGRSIPKLVATDSDGNFLFSWGPRPQVAQEIFLNWKQHPEGRSWEDFEKELHTWYARNKQVDIENELLQKSGLKPLSI